MRVLKQRGDWGAREQPTRRGRESLRQCGDVGAPHLGRTCLAMSSGDDLRSMSSVSAPMRGCAVFDTRNSAAAAARAMRKRGGQQLYVGAGSLVDALNTCEACLHQRAAICDARVRAERANVGARVLCMWTSMRTCCACER